MFDKSEQFPEGWFYIKNHNNGYVLMVENESQETGIPIVLSTLRTKNYTSQLWRYDPKGYLVNKKSGQVMDVAKGAAKAGVDIVQQIQSTNIVKEDSNFQKFGLSPYGHIYLVNKPSLVFGVKESFFSRREGLHVHLQLVDKRHLDRKEQRWDFVLPIVKDVPQQQPKRSASVSTAKSVSSTTTSMKGSTVAQIKEEDNCSIKSSSSCNIEHTKEEESSNSFPETEFFIKSEACGLFVSLEDINSKASGSKLCLAALRKKGYDSQLWKYDTSKGCITNKSTGLVLSPENNVLKDGADIVQSASDEAEHRIQSWILTHDGEISLKNDEEFVLGFKESWFSSSREGAHLHLQKRTKGHENQKFTIVLPVYKKITSTVASTSDENATDIEDSGSFPEGFFFVKNQAHGLVLTVLETGMLAAEAVVTQLDTSNYSRQLWKYSDGFLVNKVSDMVLDVRGGTLQCGASICQYTMKQHNNANQQWGLTSDGVIFIKAEKELVLSVNGNETVRSKLHLSAKQSGHKEQHWSFILPVFKKKQTSSTILKKVTFRYATYPSGWFFIRSFISGSTSEAPLVLTASQREKCSTVVLRLLDRQNWQTQLWTYSSGKLINYATDLQIDVASPIVDAQLVQNTSSSEKWCLTTDGYLFYGENTETGLVVSAIANKDHQTYSVKLAKHSYTQDNLRWGLLTPVFRYHSGVQMLSHWSITILKEWRKVIRTTTSKLLVSHSPIAEPPQIEFYISGADGYALVPEKLESGSILVIRKLEINSHEHFKWSFKNGYLVHCITGLVMTVKEGLTESASLYLTTLTDDNNPCQLWTLRTDGSIISQKDDKYGLTLVQVNGTWSVQISMFAYYSWRLLYGKYETRYSQKEKKEISYLISFQRIVLTILSTTTTRRYNQEERKLVAYSYGVFPKGWIFIRSKSDENLLITVSSAKKGAKLLLAKLDQKLFRRQLWRYREDGCLVNFDTDYVIDVAGGKLFSSANIIQWHAKFLRSSRKNQMWGLSIDGHIHPQSIPSLVLTAGDGGSAKEGAELKLAKLSDIHPDDQQWSFAVPVFKKTTHLTYEAQQAHKDNLVLEKIGNTCSISVSNSERYEHVHQRVVIRRYGVFPEGKFFIRCADGESHYVLTVERVEVAAGAKYRVVIRALNFTHYKTQLWAFQDGHLINEETGLALDAQGLDDNVIENEQSQLYLKQQSTNDGQYWDLGANGEIHLRSNQKLAIGVSQSSEASIEGAHVGLRFIRVVRTRSGEKEYVHLKSERWLQWYFSKPIFGKRVTTSTTAISSSLSTPATQGSSAVFEIEDQAVSVKEESEETPYSEEEESEDEDDFEEQVEHFETEENDMVLQTPTRTSAPATDISMSSSASVTTGAVVGKVAEAATEHTQSKIASSISTTVDTSTNIPGVISSTLEKQTDAVQNKVEAIESPSPATPLSSHVTSAKKQHVVRQDSFQLKENYTLTGFEKIVRYKTHHSGFPPGYFFVKSSLHGYVLDVLGEIRSESQVVLTKMRSTDFASQLWCYKHGSIINLKGQMFALDAAKATLVAGEKVHLSEAEGTHDQLWEHTSDGFIFLRHKRSFVLSLKETKRSDQYSHIDVFVQEAKALTKKEARPEQHWEILIPALIPVNQGESSVKIVESGRVEKVTSSASAIISYKWLKETYRHMVTSENQWPSAENWFFIRFGNENHYLCAGHTAEEQVTMQQITADIDHQRFLWVYVDGYLINLKYRLRLVLSSSHRWVLSSSHSTLNQNFHIDSSGRILIRIHKTVYYIRVIRTTVTSTTYALDVTTDEDCTDSQGLELHIPVVSDVDYQKHFVASLSSVITWVRKQRSDYRLLTTRYHKATFPTATWFFMKVDDKNCHEDLVLSTQESSSHLVLRKLDFKQFREQLWTFNDGLLINYGSKLVISVKDAVSQSAQITQSAEAATSTQKWVLTSSGHIELDTYDGHILGCETFTNNASLLLHAFQEESSSYAIRWKFSTPVFGYKKQTSTSSTQSITDVTTAIENGAVIESCEDISAANDSLHKLLLTRTTKHIITVYRETHIIIKSWIITFMRQLSTCQTQEEYMAVIAQQKQLLSSRLAQQWNITAYSLTDKDSASFETFIEETKASFETHVFQECVAYLEQFKSKDVVSLEKLNASHLLSTCQSKLDKKISRLTSTLGEKKQMAIEKAESMIHPSVNVISSARTETEYVDSILLVVETIQVTVQTWLKLLRVQITKCQGDVMTQEAHNVIRASQSQLIQKLNAYCGEITSTLTQTTHLNKELKLKLEQSVSQTMAETTEKVISVVSSSQELIGLSISEWVKRTQTATHSLIEAYDQHKVAVQDCLQVTSSENSEESEAISQSTDEHEMECSRIEMTASLSETKGYVQSWFKYLREQITWYTKSGEFDMEELHTIIQANKLDIVCILEEAIASFTLQSSSLTYMTLVERRRLITYYISIKTFILTTIETFETSTTQLSDKALLEVCDSIFDGQLQQDISTRMDRLFEVITTTEKVSQKINSITTITTTKQTEHTSNSEATVEEVDKSQLVTLEGSIEHHDANITIVNQGSGSSTTAIGSEVAAECSDERDTKTEHEHSSVTATVITKKDEIEIDQTNESSSQVQGHEQHDSSRIISGAVIGGAAVAVGVVGATIETIVHKVSDSSTDAHKNSENAENSTAITHADKLESVVGVALDTVVIEGDYSKHSTTSKEVETITTTDQVVVSEETRVSEGQTETKLSTIVEDASSSTVSKVENSNISTDIDTTITDTTSEQEVVTEAAAHVVAETESSTVNSDEHSITKATEQVEIVHENKGSSTETQKNSSVSDEKECAEGITLDHGNNTAVDQSSNDLTKQYSEQAVSVIAEAAATEKESYTQTVTEVCEESTTKQSDAVRTDTAKLTVVNETETSESNNTSACESTTSIVTEDVTEESTSNTISHETSIKTSTEASTETCAGNEVFSDQVVNTATETISEEHDTSVIVDENHTVNNETSSVEHEVTEVSTEVDTTSSEHKVITAVEETSSTTTEIITEVNTAITLDTTVTDQQDEKKSSTVTENVTEDIEEKTVIENNEAHTQVTVDHENSGFTESTQADESTEVTLDVEKQQTTTEVATSIIETEQSVTEIEVIEESSTVTDEVTPANTSLTHIDDTENKTASVVEAEQATTTIDITEESSTTIEIVNHEETSIISEKSTDDNVALDNQTTVVEQEVCHADNRTDVVNKNKQTDSSSHSSAVVDVSTAIVDKSTECTRTDIEVIGEDRVQVIDSASSTQVIAHDTMSEVVTSEEQPTELSAVIDERTEIHIGNGVANSQEQESTSIETEVVQEERHRLTLDENSIEDMPQVNESVEQSTKKNKIDTTTQGITESIEVVTDMSQKVEKVTATESTTTSQVEIVDSASAELVVVDETQENQFVEIEKETKDDTHKEATEIEIVGEHQSSSHIDFINTDVVQETTIIQESSHGQVDVSASSEVAVEITHTDGVEETTTTVVESSESIVENTNTTVITEQEEATTAEKDTVITVIDQQVEVSTGSHGETVENHTVTDVVEETSIEEAESCTEVIESNSATSVATEVGKTESITTVEHVKHVDETSTIVDQTTVESSVSIEYGDQHAPTLTAREHRVATVIEAEKTVTETTEAYERSDMNVEATVERKEETIESSEVVSPATEIIAENQSVEIVKEELETTDAYERSDMNVEATVERKEETIESSEVVSSATEIIAENQSVEIVTEVLDVSEDTITQTAEVSSTSQEVSTQEGTSESVTAINQRTEVDVSVEETISEESTAILVDSKSQESIDIAEEVVISGEISHTVSPKQSIVTEEQTTVEASTTVDEVIDEVIEEEKETGIISHDCSNSTKSDIVLDATLSAAIVAAEQKEHHSEGTVNVEIVEEEDRTCVSGEQSTVIETTRETVEQEECSVEGAVNTELVKEEGSICIVSETTKINDTTTETVEQAECSHEGAVAGEIIKEEGNACISDDTTINTTITETEIVDTSVVSEENQNTQRVEQESSILNDGDSSIITERTTESSQIVEAVTSEKEATTSTRRDSVIEAEIVFEHEEGTIAVSDQTVTTIEDHTEGNTIVSIVEGSETTSATETVSCEQSEAIIVEEGAIEQEFESSNNEAIAVGSECTSAESTYVSEAVSSKEQLSERITAAAESSRTESVTQQTKVNTGLQQVEAIDIDQATVIKDADADTTAVTSEMSEKVQNEAQHTTEVYQKTGSVDVITETTTSEEIDEIVKEEVAVIEKGGTTKHSTATGTATTVEHINNSTTVVETNDSTIEVITSESGHVVGEVIGNVGYEVVNEVVTEVVDDIEVVGKQEEFEKKSTSMDTQVLVLNKEQYQQIISTVTTHYDRVTESVCDWFISVVEKLSNVLRVEDCRTEELMTIIEKEEVKFQYIIEQSRTELSESCEKVALGSITADWSTYYSGLKKTVEEQISQLKASLVQYQQQESTESISQRLNVSLLKGQFQKTVYSQLSEARIQVIETVKTQNTTTVKTDGSSVDYTNERIVESDAQQQGVAHHGILYESIQQAQEQTKSQIVTTTVSLQEKITLWYESLFKKIKTIRLVASSNQVEYKKKIETTIQEALEEVSVIVSSCKSTFEQQQSIVSKQNSPEITESIQKAQKQAILSMESIQNIVHEQVITVQELAMSTETNTTAFEERIHTLEGQMKRKTQTTLENAVHTAVSVGFEGKTIEYVQTPELPESFRAVKYVAFDLMDTVINYRATIAKAWSQLLLQKKNEAAYCILSQIDVDTLAVQWYQLYLRKRSETEYAQSDTAVLIAALTSVLDAFSVPKTALTEAELHALASIWYKLDLFQDASASIRKVKQLNNMYAISISHAFSVRTMMDVARQGCLCWQAQFTADMFAACTINQGTSPQDSLISNTIMLLGLEDARELAVVSADPIILEAAKSCGANTVSIHHHANKSCTGVIDDKENSYVDIVFDGLDVFAESFETFHATKAIIAVPGKNSSTSNSAPTSRTWFQRVVSKVTDTAEVVGHVIIG